MKSTLLTITYTVRQNGTSPLETNKSIMSTSNRGKIELLLVRARLFAAQRLWEHIMCRPELSKKRKPICNGGMT